MQTNQLSSDEEYARMLQEQEYSMAGYPPGFSPMQSSMPPMPPMPASFLNPFLAMLRNMQPMSGDDPSTEEDNEDAPGTPGTAATPAAPAAPGTAAAPGSAPDAPTVPGAPATPGAPGAPPQMRYYTFQFSFMPPASPNQATNEENTDDDEDDEDADGTDDNAGPNFPPNLLNFLDQVLRSGPGPMGMGPIMLPQTYFAAPQVNGLPNDMLNMMQGGMSYENLLRLAELIQPVSKAAKQTTIDSLPTEPYQATGTEDSCAICLCNFEQEELVTKIPCNHRFHKECFVKWLEVNKICPVCRFDIEEAADKEAPPADSSTNVSDSAPAPAPALAPAPAAAPAAAPAPAPAPAPSYFS